MVVEDLREPVVEYGARLGKAHAVLPLVRPFLSRIPFENHRQSSAYQFPQFYSDGGCEAAFWGYQQRPDGEYARA